jgi:hypothetical protein
MEKTLTCNCGHEARAGDDDALAAEVQRHAWQAHGMALSHSGRAAARPPRRTDAAAHDRSYHTN